MLDKEEFILFVECIFLILFDIMRIFESVFFFCIFMWIIEKVKNFVII